MKTIRLIKRSQILAGHTTQQSPAPTPAAKLNQTIKTINAWVQERRNPQQQAREMFAALFSQPQT